jgi:hypothetical protein
MCRSEDGRGCGRYRAKDGAGDRVAARGHDIAVVWIDWARRPRDLTHHATTAGKPPSPMGTPGGVRRHDREGSPYAIAAHLETVSVGSLFAGGTRTSSLPATGRGLCSLARGSRIAFLEGKPTERLPRSAAGFGGGRHALLNTKE